MERKSFEDLRALFHPTLPHQRGPQITPGIRQPDRIGDLVQASNRLLLSVNGQRQIPDEPGSLSKSVQETSLEVPLAGLTSKGQALVGPGLSLVAIALQGGNDR